MSIFVAASLWRLAEEVGTTDVLIVTLVAAAIELLHVLVDRVVSGLVRVRARRPGAVVAGEFARATTIVVLLPAGAVLARHCVYD